MVTQRTANPCTPVRFRLGPPPFAIARWQPPCWYRGDRNAALAQSVEHIIRNDGVTCSSHVSGTTFLKVLYLGKSSAARIREQGLDVYGFGEQKTPESFGKACKRFTHNENLLPQPGSSSSCADAPGEISGIGTNSRQPSRQCNSAHSNSAEPVGGHGRMAFSRCSRSACHPLAVIRRERARS